MKRRGLGWRPLEEADGVDGVMRGRSSGQSVSVSERLAALSEPIRLRIARLVEREELSVGEVAAVLQLPQSTVSRHLKQLHGSGWLIRRPEGTATRYQLLEEALAESSRSVWRTVRRELDADGGVAPVLAEDDRRLRTVLADRRTDSVSFFGRHSGEWDKLRGELFGPRVTCEALLSLVPSGWCVADIGCGTGNAAEVLASHVREVIAVDRSAEMLEAAERRLSGATNVRFVRASAESLPLEDGCVDAATCLLVLHHVPAPAEALREMARVVRPGGVVLVVDMFPHDRAIYRHTMGHEHLGFSEETVCGAMAAAGLEGVRVTGLTTPSDARGPGLFAATGRRPGVSRGAFEERSDCVPGVSADRCVPGSL